MEKEKPHRQVGKFLLTLYTPDNHDAPIFTEDTVAAYVACTEGVHPDVDALVFYLDRLGDGRFRMEGYDDEYEVPPVVICEAYKLLEKNDAKV